MRDPRQPWDSLRAWLRGERPPEAAAIGREGAETSDPAPGVFQTLQVAYEQLNSRPYLIAAPLLLDLAFWLGPQVRSPALFRWFAAWPGSSNTASGRALADALVRDGERAEVTTGLAQAWNFFAVNTVTGSLGREAVASAFDRSAVELGPWYAVALLFIALALVGFWLKMLFVAPLAQLVRREPFRLRLAVRRSLPLAVRMLALYLAGMGLLALALIPFGVVGAATVLAGMDALTWVIVAALVPVAAVLFYGAFAVDALVLDGVGPMRAAYRSYRVVRGNLWPTAGFVFATGFVSWAVPLALGRVAMQPVGAALVIVAHAYVATGLATASLLFYRERHQRISSQQPAVSGQESSAANSGS